MPPVSVVVVSGVRVLREGVTALLRGESGLEATAATPGEGVERIEAARAWGVDRDAAGQPAVVALVDHSVPDLAILVACLSEHAPVVVFGVPERDSAVIACAEAGAEAYVPLDASLAELRQVLTAAAQGATVGHGGPSIVSTLMRRLAALTRAGAGDSIRSRGGDLTLREREIAQLLERGFANKQIAARLGIEVPTVKNHVHNILGKLNVHRRGEAAAQLRTWLSSGPAPVTPSVAPPGSPAGPAPSLSPRA